MATASALVPISDYLRTSYEPDAEYVDGFIEERPMGEYDHSSWQGALVRWFQAHDKEWNIRVRVELRVRVSETRYRVPDVAVINRALPVEQILTHPPVAVFEVLSPEDTMSRLMRKLADYAQMGIQNIFVIDPKSERAYRYGEGDLDLCRNEKEPLDGTVAEINWPMVIEHLAD